MRAMCRRASIARTSGSAGVAAVEFLFVLPILLLLFLGMVNLTDYISMHRRVNAAAGLVTDLVTRNEKTIDKDALADYAIAAKLAMRPFDGSTPHIDVYDFYKSGTTAATRWKWSSDSNGDCTTPTADPSDAQDPIGKLLNDGNDVIVSVLCMAYIPPDSTFPGFQQIFANRTIEKRAIGRPRHSDAISCTTQNCS